MSLTVDLPKKLNAGCGPLPLYPQDGKFMEITPDKTLLDVVKDWILVDKFIEGPGIQNWDMEDLKEIPDGHLELIYSSHALEHISHKKVAQVLEVWYRKLQVGGKLVLNVPDLGWTAKQIIDYEKGKKLKGLYVDFFGPFGLINIIYGSHSQIGEVHFSGFTKRSLQDLLEQAGFKNIEIKQEYEEHEMQCLIATAIK